MRMHATQDEDGDEGDDILSVTPTKKAAKKPAAKAGTEAKKAAKKPSKATVTKAAPAEREAKAAPKKAKKAVDDDVSTSQPEDKVVLAAVRKLKEPTLAASFAANLGVHRRVIRSQLQRLAKDKANGVKMTKDGFNWYVSAK